MPRPVASRFGLADLMILIAFNAVGLGCFLVIDDNLYGSQRFLFGIFSPWPATWNSTTVLDRLDGAFAATITTFGGWTIALPILGLRRPRPVRSRLFRGPGLGACVAAMVGLAMLVGTAGLAPLLRWGDGRLPLPANFWYAVPIEAVFIFPGVAVAATWTSRLMTSRWRASSDLIDRLGRFVGGLWLAAGLVFATRLFLG